MFVKQHGRGEQAYFCLHGWSGDHRSFEPLARFLPDNARLYAADMPGCGLSPAPKAWNLQTITREIVDAFEKTDAAELTLVGNCIGALLGMRAAMGTRMVRRLILIDAFAKWPWYFRVFTAPGWGAKAYACTFANPVGRWITNEVLASRRSAGSNLTRGFAGARHETQLKYLHVVSELRDAGEFASLDLPVDVIFGLRTFRAVRESAAVWREMWPQTRIWPLKDTGHLVLTEAAGLVGEIAFGGGACDRESVLTLNSARI